MSMSTSMSMSGVGEGCCGKNKSKASGHYLCFTPFQSNVGDIAQTKGGGEKRDRRREDRVHGGRCGRCGARVRGYLSPSHPSSPISANTRTHACMHVQGICHMQIQTDVAVCGQTRTNSRHVAGSSARGVSVAREQTMYIQ